jgi:hypothetical protein
MGMGMHGWVGQFGERAASPLGFATPLFTRSYQCQCQCQYYHAKQSRERHIVRGLDIKIKIKIKIGSAKLRFAMLQ